MIELFEWFHKRRTKSATPLKNLPMTPEAAEMLKEIVTSREKVILAVAYHIAVVKHYDTRKTITEEDIDIAIKMSAVLFGKV
jgi:histone H3/H4